MSRNKPQIGATLNRRYQLLDELGSGGMGVVYRANDPVLHREVAVKVLTPQAHNPRNLERFRNEARAVANLKHPNIGTIHDFGEEDGMPFIVMELIRGRSLAERMPLPFEEALPFIHSICQALGHAHQSGVTHRDLKPENVLIAEPEGVAKLVDFGIAHISASRLTMEGELVGTLAYMAPEQITGGDIDARTDLYAIGILLYELATGSHPFDASDVYQLMYHQLTTPAQPPVGLVPDLPPALNDLILRLLAKDPNDRPDSVAEVLPVLEALDGAPTSELPYRRTNPGPPRELSRITVPGSLAGLKAPGAEYLDAMNLSLILQYPPEARYAGDDLDLLFRSVVHNRQDLGDWLGRARTEAEALETVMAFCRERPRPEIRTRLVEAIARIDSEEAVDCLVEIAGSDENHLVRTQASLLAAQRGRLDEIVAALRADIESHQDPTALAAYVALADEFDIRIRPNLQNLSFLLLLGQRRWASQGAAIRRQAWRAALGAGTFAAVAGALRPIFMYTWDPADYQANLESLGLPIWPILAAAVLFTIGLALGYAAALLVGISDMVSASQTMRYSAGALSGLVYTGYLVLFSSLELIARPGLGMGVYVLTAFATGLGVGALLTPVVPGINSRPPRGRHMRRAALSAAGLAALAAVSTQLLTLNTPLDEHVNQMTFLAMAALGLGFALSESQQSRI